MLEETLKSESGSGEFYLQAGDRLRKSGQLDEAIACYQKALEIQPTLAEARGNIGLVLLQQGKQKGGIIISQLDFAISSLLKAIEAKPDLLAVHQGLWDLLLTLGTEDKLFDSFQRLAQKYSEVGGEAGKILSIAAFLTAHLNAGRYELARNKFWELEAQVYLLKNYLSQLPNIAALYSTLLFGAPFFRDDLKANSKLFEVAAKPYGQYIQQYAARDRDESANSLLKNKNIESQLRIGFLSKHFRRHSVGWCSADIIRELSHLTPHIYLYATARINSDDRTQIFEKAAAKFDRVQQTISAGEITEKIVQDELDILVDMDSITVPMQVEILYSQPTAICISWLGFEPPFISGENYFLGDWHSHPTEIEKYYVEKLVRMPDSFVAVSGFETTPVNREAARKSLRISSEQIAYLSVSPGRKLNSELIKAQVQILKNVPDSVLLHKGLGSKQVIQAMYKQECEAQKVGFYRIKFLERSRSEEEHRTIYQIADVLLDSYPYNGGTHNLEALWFNLPLVTRAGEQALSRMGYSFLKTLEIKAGIAQSWEEYVFWGIRFGKDATLRNEIRDRLLQSKQPASLAPLWNPKKFASDMYAVFEELLARTSGDPLS